LDASERLHTGEVDTEEIADADPPNEEVSDESPEDFSREGSVNSPSSLIQEDHSHGEQEILSLIQQDLARLKNVPQASELVGRLQSNFSLLQANFTADHNRVGTLVDQRDQLNQEIQSKDTTITRQSADIATLKKQLATGEGDLSFTELNSSSDSMSKTLKSAVALVTSLQPHSREGSFDDSEIDEDEEGEDISTDDDDDDGLGVKTTMSNDELSEMLVSAKAMAAAAADDTSINDQLKHATLERNQLVWTSLPCPSLHSSTIHYFIIFPQLDDIGQLQVFAQMVATLLKREDLHDTDDIVKKQLFFLSFPRFFFL